MSISREYRSVPRKGFLLRLVVLLALLLATFVGCAESESVSETAASAAGQPTLWAALAGDQGMSGQLLVADLGKTTPRATGTTSVVWGSVVAVEPGPTAVAAEDGSATKSIAVGSDDSMWVHLIVEPKRSMGDDLPSRVRIEVPRPTRWAASQLGDLAAGEFVGVLVPVEGVFEGQKGIADQYARRWKEPVYRVFANAVFTEPEAVVAPTKAEREDVNLPQPGQIYGPLLDPADYATLLKSAVAANGGEPVETLGQLWTYLESANR